MNPPHSHSRARVRARPRLQADVRIIWHANGRTCEVEHPLGNHELNRSAGEILALCDGTRDLDGIIAELELRFQICGLAADVYRFLDEARNRGWID